MRMRVVLQRVKESRVEVKGKVVGEVGTGVMVLVGVGEGDSEQDCEYLAGKIVNLRIFPDDRGAMNLSLLDTGGAALVVSQFTLMGDCRKGRRPSFSRAAEPVRARELYEYFVSRVSSYGVRTATGRFQEMMDVHLVNDGPVTLILDSGKRF